METASGGTIAEAAGAAIAPLLGAAVVGYVAVGAAAIVADDVAGTDTGVPGGVPRTAATELADGGVAAAVTPCGAAWVDGSAGADRATSDESSDGVSFAHHAQRGPDWQPAMPTTVTRISAVWMARDFMVPLPLGFTGQTSVPVAANARRDATPELRDVATRSYRAAYSGIIE